MVKRQIYQVSQRVPIRVTSKGPHYRTSAKQFRSYEKAEKHYDRQIELHSPEREITIGNISSGLFNCVISDNRVEHVLYLNDEHGYNSGFYNLDVIRKSIKPTEDTDENLPGN